LSNGLGLGRSLEGDGVLKSLGGFGLGTELLAHLAALAGLGESWASTLEVGESTVKSSLKTLDVGGDANSVVEGEVRAGSNGLSTVGGERLNLGGGLEDSLGIATRVSLDSSVKRLDSRVDVVQHGVDGIGTTGGHGRASEGNGNSG